MALPAAERAELGGEWRSQRVAGVVDGLPGGRFGVTRFGLKSTWVGRADT